MNIYLQFSSGTKLPHHGMAQFKIPVEDVSSIGFGIYGKVIVVCCINGNTYEVSHKGIEIVKEAS